MHSLLDLMQLKGEKGMLFTDKLHDGPGSRNMRLLLHISVDQEAESKGNADIPLALCSGP